MTQMERVAYPIHIGTLYTSITLSKQQLRKYPRFSILKRGEFYDFLQPSLVSTDCINLQITFTDKPEMKTTSFIKDSRIFSSDEILWNMSLFNLEGKLKFV